MDRFDVVRFDDLTGPRGGEWVRIGGGSFGVVFRGEYLGTEVAIKEVLANNTYDVEKYFERECVLMKEARHPNIVQYIGLTRSPGHDGRIYIISEFVGGNLRSYIADKRKPFDWRLRVSFATDIARAVAYLHARNCMHRDLKGENLLITDNQRIKVCDFGFARIAARNEDEMRRISYCGTDGYMSPEILMGIDFSLPSDVFSLGIIFCEIISRHLVDSHTFKRQMPTFGLDEDEVRSMATKGCPTDFIQLCLDMCEVEPERRPTMRHIIRRLRAIEQEIVNREAASGTLSNIGSVRGANLAAISGSRLGKNGKHSKANRLPSFDGAVKVGRKDSSASRTGHLQDISDETCTSSEEEEDVEEALAALEKLSIDKKSINAAQSFKFSGHGNPWAWDPKDTLETVSGVKHAEDEDHIEAAGTPTIIMKKNDDAAKGAEGHAPQEGEYSTSVVRTSKVDKRESLTASLSRMTGSKVSKESGAGPQPQAEPSQVGSTATVLRRRPLEPVATNGGEEEAKPQDAIETKSKQRTEETKRDDAMEVDDTPQSYLTAKDERIGEGNDAIAENGHAVEPSLAVATIASMSIHEQPGALLYHRFTLVKNGVRRPNIDGGKQGARTPNARIPSPMPSSRVPYQLMLANALTKCSVCSRRLGFQAYMDCDDCPYKTHVACADAAEPNCQEIHIPSGSEDVGAPFEPSQAKPTTAKAAATASKAVARGIIDSTPAGGVSFLRKRYSSPPPKKAP